LRRVVLRGRHRRLRPQILELLEADDLVGVEVLAALEIALRLVSHLSRLFHLRADFGEFDLGQSLALLHHVAFLHVDAAHDATHLERQAHLVLRGDDAAGVDGRHRRSVARVLDAHRRWPVSRGGFLPAAA
jgi:hypothetical protein